jgi:hypothetical protein
MEKHGGVELFVPWTHRGSTPPKQRTAMTTPAESEPIDWESLLCEFESFQPDEEMSRLDCAAFVCSLLDPVPEFVEAFIERKTRGGYAHDEAIRALYCFFLKKRYDERLNLLHFAFNIFDEKTFLPEEIVNQTPFPHEEGIPRFKHLLDPNYRLKR